MNFVVAMHSSQLYGAEQTKNGGLEEECSIFGIIAIDSSFKNKKIGNISEFK